MQVVTLHAALLLRKAAQGCLLERLRFLHSRVQAQ